MSVGPIAIPRRPSLALFVALATGMVFLSYVVVIVLAIGCVYLPWLVMSNVANFQTLALMVAGVIVAGSLIWSLVPRRDKFQAPGLLLDRATHPRLFAELDDIAAALNEPLPTEVYLIGQVNAFVADRGGIMGFGSRRVMGVGLPLLAILNISQFRAVLAHEFAHYYGGDTKLGPWLYRTKMAMIRTFQNMGSVGQAMRVALMQVLYYIVFGILQGYWKLFLRAINFVSRRQEYRADELACLVAGAQPLTSGLRAIHGAALAWPAYLRDELGPMFSMACLPPIGDGFSRFMAAPLIAKQVQSGVEKEIQEGKAEPYDSHPRLRDRISAAESLGLQPVPEETRCALMLLDNISDEEARFLRFADPELMKHPLRRVSWDECETSVIIPWWTNFVHEHAALIAGVSVADIPELLQKLPDIAPQIRDPKGMLLAPPQRVERARVLVATAFALVMLNNGWRLDASPGQSSLERNGEKIDPFQLVLQLSGGKITKDEWLSKCREFGIGEMMLVGGQTVASAAGQGSLSF